MSDFETRRRMMVDTQIRPSDVTKYPIIDAILTVPRERFVPNERRQVAYMDEHVTLSSSRKLLAPRVFARMLDAVGVTGQSLVLIVGSGTGYGAAVVSRIAEAVVAVEEDEELAREAEAILPELGADNVVLQKGPLTTGAAELGPFDIIIIEGGVERIPEELEAQLAENGRIVAVFMDGPLGKARIGIRSGDHVSWRFAFDGNAELLSGFAKEEDFSL